MLDDDIKCVGNYVNEGFGLTTPVMESFNRIITELKEAQERANNKQSAPCISCNTVTTNIVHLCKSCEGNFE